MSGIYSQREGVELSFALAFANQPLTLDTTITILFSRRRTGAICHNDFTHCPRCRWRGLSRMGLRRPSESQTSQRYRQVETTQNDM